MKSTTVRFADPVYAELEIASSMTGLPINSIVTIACLDWLRQQRSHQVPLEMGRTVLARTHPLRRPYRSWSSLVPPPLMGTDPLWIFTACAQDALGHAQAEAERSHRPWIGTGHLLHGLYAVEEGRAGQALRRLGVDVASVLAEWAEPAGEPQGRLLPTRQLRDTLKRAHEEAERANTSQVGTDHLLLGLLAGQSEVGRALIAAGVADDAVREALAGLEAEV